MLHIHNGDVVAAMARRVAIPGEHLVFRESLIAGPVQPWARWLETRAKFLAAAHREDLLRVSHGLFEQEQMLDAVRGKYEEVVLWFEHDLFCLTHLLYLLQRIQHPRMTLIWSPTPLTQQTEDELLMLYQSRMAVTPSMLTAAKDVWNAYIAADPTSLNQWLASEHPDFPFLRAGLRLHASRFPSLFNGLGELEQRALTLLAGGASDFNALFPLIDEQQPRFGFGDSEIMRLLRGLAGRAVPLISLTEYEGEVPPRALLSITPAGENVLAGRVDDVSVNDPDQWFGGVHLTKENVWRWDADRRQLLRNPSAGS